MPLPLPALDDRTFDVLVTEAIKIIPRQAPEWTDHNLHDPGITLIELFAWLAEMQGYYLDQIRPANYLKFLRLVGVTPRAATAARGRVTFSLPAQPPASVVAVPRGAKLAAGDVVFETTDPLLVVSTALEMVLTSSAAGLKDNTEANRIEGLSYDAFGEDATAGSRLYLGFSKAQPFPAGQTISLTCDLFEDYRVPVGSHGDEPAEVIPSATISWEYYAASGQWADLAPVADETLMLSRSGRLFFVAPADMQPRGVHPFNTERFWLRATVNQAGYELPPRIDTLILNTVPVVQQDTLSETTSFSGLGVAGQTTAASSYLALRGQCIVQVHEPAGWRDWQEVPDWVASGPSDRHYTLTPDVPTGQVRITFGDAVRGRIPPAGTDNIRLIAFLKESAPLLSLGPSNGLPGQRFTLGRYPVAADGVRVQVREPLQAATFERVMQDVACLLHFERTVVPQGGADEPIFDITITVEAHRPLPRIEIVEALHLAPLGDTTRRFVREGIGAGEKFSFSYQISATAQGGSIDGTITITDQCGGICPPIIEPTPRSVVEVAAQGVECWQDWLPVPDFDASGPADRHYVLDTETSELQFGDGVNGDIPYAQAQPADGSAAAKNIRLIAYRTGGSDQGNLGTGVITRIVGAAPGLAPLTVQNRRALTGGAAAETLAEAQTRARRDLRVAYRAVTTPDFEFLARATPCLRVARAQALPLLAPDAQGRLQPAAAAVTVVVVPESVSPRPTPSAAFRQTICRHLDRHRLLTTQLHIIGPEYVKVSVQASVLLKAGTVRNVVQDAILTALQDFLDPLRGGPPPSPAGWPFGRPVYRSEVYQCIEGVTGVDCVDRLALVGEGDGVGRDADGNLTIPPHSLVYSGDHRVEVVTPGAACRMGC